MTLNAVLLLLELLLLSGGMLGLHALSRRSGLGPVLLGLAGLVAVLQTTAWLPVFIDVAGVRVLLSDVLLIPVILLTILVLYEVNGTAVARWSVMGVLVVSLVMLGVDLLTLLHLKLPGGFTSADVSAASVVLQYSGRSAAVSVVAFAVSLATIVVVHQALRNRLPAPAADWLAPGAALLAALLVDDLAFRVPALGWEAYRARMPDAVFARVAAGLVLWPLAAVYLRWARSAFEGYSGAERRGAFDLFLAHTDRAARLLQTLERQHARTAERLEAVVSHAPLIVFVLDRNGRFVLSEGAGLSRLGLAPDAVVGRSAFELYPQVEPYIRRALGGESLRAIVEVNDVVYDVTYVPTFDDDGGVAGVIGVATDISERARAEHALREAMLRFRSTFDHAGVGLAHLDPDRGVALANPALATLSGREAASLKGLDVLELFGPEDRAACATDLARIQRGETDRIEQDCRLLRPDGGHAWVHVTATAVRGDDGALRYIVMVFEDLSERLETEERLRQAQKMEAVGQLTGGIAHDFNNLLTVVISGIDMVLREGNPDPAARQMLEEALGAAQRGAALTRELLVFARRQPMRPVALDAGALLQEMTHLLTPTLGERIRIELRLPSEPTFCMADRSQLESAILNLALNARDAMAGRGVLTLGVEPLDVPADGETPLPEGLNPGRYVRIFVQDTGTGMEEEALTRAFDPFFTTKEVGKGSGLGLSMVYGFAKQMQGYVELRNRPEGGLEASLYLPRTDAPAPAPKPADSPGAPARARRPGDARILVVEDDPAVREVTARIVASLGYRAETVADATQALELLKADGAFDLVLSDCVLPGALSGFDLAAEIHRRWPHLPVVLTSGYAGEHLTDLSRAEVQAPLVAKPFQRDELARVLEEALGGG